MIPAGLVKRRQWNSVLSVWLAVVMTGIPYEISVNLYAAEAVSEKPTEQTSEQQPGQATAPLASEGAIETRGIGITTRVLMGGVPPTGHTVAAVTAPGSEKLIGGGAFADWRGAGSLLTSSGPNGLTRWEASAKDHGMADPSTLTAYAILLQDSANMWEVTVREATSPVSAHPSISVTSPSGYVMASGGCRVNWKTSPTAPGNLLTASFPSSPTTWECRSKDHSYASPASITAYVIAIRPRNQATTLPQIQIDQASSAVGPSPAVQVRASRPGYVVTGGGAQTIVPPTAGGQLLTQSAPLLDAGSGAPIGWLARSKDHLVPSPGTVITYVISLNLNGVGSGGGMTQAQTIQPQMLQPLSKVPGSAGGMTQAQAIRAYVDALPRLALVQSRPSTLAPIPNLPEGVSGTQLSGGIFVNQQAELAILKSSSDIMWPGALVQGISIAGNNFAPIILPRSPGRVRLAGNFIGGTSASKFRDLPVIGAGEVEQARDSMLRELAPTDAVGTLFLDTQSAGTLREAMVKLGFAYEAATVSASLNASLNTSLSEHTLVAKFTRVFYTVGFDPDPSTPSPFFGPTVTLDQVKRTTAPNNPPLYVNEVKYGQVFLVSFTSTLSKQEMEAAVRGAYNGFSGSADLRYKEALSRMSMKVLSIGNTGEALLLSIQARTPDEAFNALRNLVVSGGRYNPVTNPGAPIILKMRYVGSLAGQGPYAEAIAQMVTDLSPEVVDLNAVPMCKGPFYVWDGPGGGWKDTGIIANPGDKVHIEATGSNWSGVFATGDYGPGGWYGWSEPAGGGVGYPITDRPPFTLIARFGGQSISGVDTTKETYSRGNGKPASSWFFVGDSMDFTAGTVDSQTGRGTPGYGAIILSTNDNEPLNGDPNKKFEVKVCVTRKVY